MGKREFHVANAACISIFKACVPFFRLPLSIKGCALLLLSAAISPLVPVIIADNVHGQAALVRIFFIAYAVDYLLSFADEFFRDWNKR